MTIKVLIVEDDPMVAEFNKRYLHMIEGYELLGIAGSAEEATQWLKEKGNEIHLMLLDVYMPGQTGLEMLSAIREKALPIDVILITAADDTENIQTALHYGAIDYLIKPFEFDRFKQALLLYKEKFELMHGRESLNQKELDQKLLRAKQEKLLEQKVLAKGLTKSTLAAIMEKLPKEKSFTTDEIARSTGISRVSVRKYLFFLEEIEVLEETLTYGIGRPVSHYKYKGNSKNVDAYLK
ncbi:response regulator [Alkalicoccus daliensis]|uniref:Two-component system, CitB family, response regulator MalR n=1 Tax=Alkalicoccus daliensis TaxID=745820 RepID=A0A1H0HEZ2_9BACI|nr:response regulator [Alkalicoccus daliensis]SDO17742.1 two-component system, CitB family, response regulator MalR [Alkalicoccus daliensis]